MKWTNLILCLFLVPCVLCDCPKVRGYFWRDYLLDIPEDALKVGEDAKGTSIYIGQTLKEEPYGAHLVGHIDPVHEQMFYAFESKPIIVKQNIKILCSSFPEDFEWTTTNISLISPSLERNLVVGGYDTYPLFIARIQLGNGAVAVGKLTLDPTYQSFAYIVDGKVFYEGEKFEALSYISGRKQSNSKTKCDARLVKINVFY